MYDILIRNGIIVDGTGAPSYKADIAAKDGNIVKIAADIKGEAKETIDASGRIVTPGFIDYHSHSDMFAIFGTDAHNFLEQGITTEIAGHCGNSPAPIFERPYSLFRNLVSEEQFNEIKANCDSFTNFAKYVSKLRLGTNMAFYAGQGAIRAKVMGYSSEKPTAEQLEAMRAQVREAMENGFLGISTGLIYPASIYADEDEIVELAKEAAKYGGSYVSHIRGESDTVVEAVSEAISVGERAGCEVIISHHKVAGPKNIGKSAITLKLIEDANARGVYTRADQYPYLAGSTELIAALPPKFATGGKQALVEKLNNPEFRNEVTAALKADDFGESLLINSTFEGCMILRADGTPENIGKSIAEVAALRGSDPYETVYDLLLENNGTIGMAYFMINEADMDAIIAHPFVMPGTDAAHRTEKVDAKKAGGGHPRATGTFPKHFRLVRERNLFPVEQAVYRATGMPAETAKIDKIGYLKEGYAADICIIDWDNFKEGSDFMHPFRRNEGLDYVIVSGQIAVENNAANGVMAGRILKMRKAK